jgi:3-hydroxyacyl-CoA dehydrogenase
MHALGAGVIDGVIEAVARRRAATLDALVIWHEAPFAVGANLQQVAQACQAGEFDHARAHGGALPAGVDVPAAGAGAGGRGGAGPGAGGRLRIRDACDRVMALESYVGLVEVGVGLIPAGGGSKEFAVQAHASRREAKGGDLLPVHAALCVRGDRDGQGVAQRRGGQCNSALSSFPMTIVFNPNELLYVAKARFARAGRDRLPTAAGRAAIRVAGRTGVAACQMALVNLRDGGFISAHDYQLGLKIATALCGGDVDPNTRVDEAWLLGLERQGFVELAKTERTQARIEHLLETGKPLRN